MKLAGAEMLRDRSRFAAMVGALALLVFLVLILSALADGLYYGATGAVRASGADLYTLSVDARDQLVRSSLPAADAATIASVAGVASVGAIGILQATGRCSGRCPSGLFDLALFGYTPGRPGGPAEAVKGRIPGQSQTGVAAADVSLEEKGVRIGDRITIAGTTAPLTIVGFTSDSRYELQPTLWTTIATWRTVQAQARPELAGEPATVQAFAETLRQGASPEAVAAAIDTATSGQTRTIDRQMTIASLPGVSEQRSTLDGIVDATLAVVGIVIALFFALVTLEKRGQLAVLKAIGASNRYLATSIVVQSVILCSVGLVVGIVVSRIVAIVLPETVPLTFRGTSAATVAAATLAMGAVGASFSFWTVARIDAAGALGGA